MAFYSIFQYGIVYCITNLVNNKKYVGQTVKSLQERLKTHKNNSKKKSIMTDAIRKYGIENFIIEELFICKSIEELNLMEQFAVKYLQTMAPNGYNLRPGGNMRGPFSEESIAKFKKSRLSRPPTEKEIIRGQIPTKTLKYKFISPDGEIHEGENLAKFCRENNLIANCMRQVLLKNVSHHKGWKKFLELGEIPYNRKKRSLKNG